MSSTPQPPRSAHGRRTCCPGQHAGGRHEQRWNASGRRSVGGGLAADEPTEQQRRRLAASLARRYGVEPRVEPAAPVEGRTCARPVWGAGRPGAGLHHRPLEGPGTPTGWPTPIVCGRSGAVRRPTRRRRLPGRRARAGGRPRLVRHGRPCDRPLRRRVVRGVGRESAGRCGERRDGRPHGDGPGHRDRSHLPGRSHPGRGAGTRGGRPAAPARAHAAPLPAVVRVVDGGAGSPLARAVTTPPTRPTSTTSSSRCGCSHRPAGGTPAARQRRGPEPGPTRARQRGHAGHRVRGMAPGAAPAEVPRRRRRPVSVVEAGWRGCRRSSSEAVAGQPPHPRSGRGPAAPASTGTPTRDRRVRVRRRIPAGQRRRGGRPCPRSRWADRRRRHQGHRRRRAHRPPRFRGRLARQLRGLRPEQHDRPGSTRSSRPSPGTAGPTSTPRCGRR